MSVPVGNRWVGSELWVTKCKWATPRVLLSCRNLQISRSRSVPSPSEFHCTQCIYTADRTAPSSPLQRPSQKSPRRHLSLFSVRRPRCCLSTPLEVFAREKEAAVSAKTHPLVSLGSSCWGWVWALQQLLGSHLWFFTLNVTGSRNRNSLLIFWPFTFITFWQKKKKKWKHIQYFREYGKPVEGFAAKEVAQKISSSRTFGAVATGSSGIIHGQHSVCTSCLTFQAPWTRKHGNLQFMPFSSLFAYILLRSLV